MKVFIDTNVFIDNIAHREKFYRAAHLVIGYISDMHLEILVSALSFATASYILQAHHKMPSEAINQKFKEFINFASITTVDVNTVRQAVRSNIKDFEDAMQYHSALSMNADVIITRNKEDFIFSDIPVLEPQEFLDSLS